MPGALKPCLCEYGVHTSHVQGVLKRLIIRRGRSLFFPPGPKGGGQYNNGPYTPLAPTGPESSEGGEQYSWQYMVVLVTSKDVPSDQLQPIVDAVMAAEPSVSGGGGGGSG